MPQIAQFLHDDGLGFRGFQLERNTFRAVPAAVSASDLAGRTGSMDEFEAAHPHAFNGMYKLWCARG